MGLAAEYQQEMFAAVSKSDAGALAVASGEAEALSDREVVEVLMRQVGVINNWMTRALSELDQIKAS